MKTCTIRWRGILSTLAIPAALALLLGAGLVLPPAARAVDQPECAKGKPPNLASNCPDQFAWQIFDRKVVHLLRDEYRIKRVTKVTAETLTLAP